MINPELQTKLDQGEPVKVIVKARKKHNPAKISLTKGYSYVFLHEGIWHDGWAGTKQTCGGEGWESEQAKPRFLKGAVRSVESKRRVPEANWMELIGIIGRKTKGGFRVGNGQFSSESNPYVEPEGGELFLYANDLKWMYWNNSGKISVKVRRVQGVAFVS